MRYVTQLTEDRQIEIKVEGIPHQKLRENPHGCVDTHTYGTTKHKNTMQTSGSFNIGMKSEEQSVLKVSKATQEVLQGVGISSLLEVRIYPRFRWGSHWCLPARLLRYTF